MDFELYPPPSDLSCSAENLAAIDGVPTHVYHQAGTVTIRNNRVTRVGWHQVDAWQSLVPLIRHEQLTGHADLANT
jgi:hypothetical protein